MAEKRKHDTAVDDASGTPGEARYLFDAESIRSASEPSPDGTRLVWMLLRLLRTREIDFAAFAKEFRHSEKTFQRDVAKLRTIGADYEFTLTRRKNGRVFLSSVSEIADPRKKASAITADTLRAVADALGELVSNDIFAAIDTASAPHDPFLRLAMPQLIDHTNVARTYATLREAWRGRARVRFRYPSGREFGKPTFEERVVEPHHVAYYDGRYYLVAYDARPKTAAWRQFALDRIQGPIARSGTFTRRPVPHNYRGEDSLGLFKSAPPVEIAIAISPEIARSVLARRWQRHQRVIEHPGAWPVVTFDVCDLGEAVRWAFGFGENARVVSPPQAVDLARRLALQVADAHAVPMHEKA
jgi:predicted DNA-binding transcriptional regulator YafY